MTDFPDDFRPSSIQEDCVCEPACEKSPNSLTPIDELPASGRGADGRFVVGPGNRGNWRHGGRSRYVATGKTPEQLDALAVLAERQSQIEKDLGGRDNLSRLASDTVSDYIRLRMIADYLAENLLREGPLTGKGRQRAALNAYLSVVDRTQRIASALGLSRRQKTLPTISEYLAHKTKEERR